MMPRPALRSRLRNLKQENPMNVNHYIGFDVHKKSVSYCVKTGDGRIVEEGKLPATRQALRQWAQQRTELWHGAMEATLFSGWIYDALKPYAAELQMGHPAMMKAIGGVQEKERPAGRTQNRRSGALQFAAGVLRSSGGDSGTAALAPLPQCGGGAGGAHEEQDERPTDGSGRAVQQAATARQAVLQRIARPVGRSTRVGERSTTVEPDHAGSVRSHAAAVNGEAAARSAADGAGEVVDRDWWSG